MDDEWTQEQMSEMADRLERSAQPNADKSEYKDAASMLRFAAELAERQHPRFTHTISTRLATALQANEKLVAQCVALRVAARDRWLGTKVGDALLAYMDAIGLPDGPTGSNG